MKISCFYRWYTMHCFIFTCVYAQGFRQKKAFIIAQGPSEDLCSDFWKMITRHKCGAVVMLSDKFEYNQVQTSGEISHGNKLLVCIG